MNIRAAMIEERRLRPSAVSAGVSFTAPVIAGIRARGAFVRVPFVSVAFAFLALLCLALVALPLSAAAADPWLKLDKSATGFLFRGVGADTPFSFDVPGKAVRTAREGERAFVEIDGVVLQLFKTDRGEGDDKAVLDAYRKSETAYLSKHGLKIADSDICSALKAPHREWRGTAKNGAVSVFLVVPLRRSLLVVVAAAADKASEPSARDRLAAVCRTYKV